ncbi:MAG TPA: MerR family transcriptional regulator [Streptosporangiaceae bacterium]
MPSLPLDDENLPLYTVGQVAATLEVQHAFLRRLDEHGVVQPTRSAGGQRRYTRREVTVVQYVLRLVDDGMTLAAVRRVLQLEERIGQLEAERDALRAAVGQRDELIVRLRAFGKIKEPDDQGQPGTAGPWPPRTAQPGQPGPR